MSEEQKAGKFLELFNKGKEFTEKLLRENQKLRYRVAALETEHAAVSLEELTRLREQIQQLTEENPASSSASAKSRKKTRTSPTATSRSKSRTGGRCPSAARPSATSSSMRPAGSMPGKTRDTGNFSSRSSRTSTNC
jgi:hypothetical protein